MRTPELLRQLPATRRRWPTTSPVGIASTDVADRPRERLVLVLVLAELLILYGPTIRWLVDRWTTSVWHHIHGLFIPPLVAYFVYRELRRRRPLPRESSAWGFTILVPALTLHVLDTSMHTQLLSAVSLVLVLPGLSLMFLGARTTGKILFPLAFLAFMLPIPATLVEPIHVRLRLIATHATAAILEVLGIPVLAERTTLHLPNAVLEVSDACSGFSTLYATSALACLTAYATSGRWRRAVVLVAAGPLAIGANILRVIALVLLVWWQGGEVLGTLLHPLSGMVAFALVVFVVTSLSRTCEVPPEKAS
jgi:exosortase